MKKIIILAMLLFSVAFAQKDVADLAEFFTFDNLLLVFSFLTPLLTSWAKRLFKTEGKATVAVNAFMNVLAKGVLLVSTGEATISYAIAWIIIGLILDKTLHSTIKAQTVAKP